MQFCEIQVASEIAPVWTTCFILIQVIKLKSYQETKVHLVNFFVILIIQMQAMKTLVGKLSTKSVKIIYLVGLMIKVQPEANQSYMLL